MKRIIGVTVATLLFSQFCAAKDVKMTKQQEKNWDIKVISPQRSDSYPLGNVIVKVVTPPSLLHAISLPFEATVKELFVTQYEGVVPGQLLAKVTGTAWIEAQKKAVAEAIEYRHHKHLTERKLRLCEEGIIPQKECRAAKAELKTDEIRMEASKALLRSYGADDNVVKTLYETLQIVDALPIRSRVEGSIISLRAVPGKTVAPSTALFVIKSKGKLWIEAEIEALRTLKLKEGEGVRFFVADKVFESHVLQLADVVNPENQTRLVRFEVPSYVTLAPGLVLSAHLVVFGDTLKIKKSALIKKGGTYIVFIKTDFGFRAQGVEVLAEDDNYYYIKPMEVLQGKRIAANSLPILKNLLGESEDE